MGWALIKGFFISITDLKNKILIIYLLNLFNNKNV